MGTSVVATSETFQEIMGRSFSGRFSPYPTRVRQ